MSRTTMSSPFVFGQERGPVFRHERMNARLDPVQEIGVIRDRSPERRTADAAILLDRVRRDIRQGAGPVTAGGIDTVHRRVCIPDRHAQLREHARRGGLSHPDRTCQTKDRPGHASTAARNSSSTVGV